MIDHEDARLQLADLILPGLGDPTRTASLRAHVSVCPDCRSELDDLRYVDGLVRASGPMPEPSAALDARIAAITGSEPAARGAGWRRRFQSVTTWRVATAGLAVATAVLAVLAFTGDSSDAFQPTQERAMTTSDKWAGASGTVVNGTVDGAPALRIELSDVQPPAAGTTYEVWIAEDPKARISLGTIEPDASGKATVTVPLPAAADGFKRVWVTSEPADGDPKWTTNWIVRAA